MKISATKKAATANRPPLGRPKSGAVWLTRKQERAREERQRQAQQGKLF